MARSNCSAFMEQRYAICLIHYGITNLKYPLIRKNGVKKEGAERNPHLPEHRKENYHIFAAKCFCYLSDEFI